MATYYEIYIDGDLACSSDFNDGILNPKLSKEINTAGKLEFTMLPNHPKINSLVEYRTSVEVYINERCEFNGRVSSISEDFYGQKTVECEGALAFFIDTIVPKLKSVNARDKISDVISYHRQGVIGYPLGMVQEDFEHYGGFGRDKSFNLGIMEPEGDKNYLDIGNPIRGYINTYIHYDEEVGEDITSIRIIESPSAQTFVVKSIEPLRFYRDPELLLYEDYMMTVTLDRINDDLKVRYNPADFSQPRGYEEDNYAIKVYIVADFTGSGRSYDNELIATYTVTGAQLGINNLSSSQYAERKINITSVIDGWETFDIYIYVQIAEGYYYNSELRRIVYTNKPYANPWIQITSAAIDSFIKSSKYSETTEVTTCGDAIETLFIDSRDLMVRCRSNSNKNTYFRNLIDFLNPHRVLGAKDLIVSDNVFNIETDSSDKEPCTAIIATKNGALIGSGESYDPMMGFEYSKYVHYFIDSGGIMRSDLPSPYARGELPIYKIVDVGADATTDSAYDRLEYYAILYLAKNRNRINPYKITALDKGIYFDQDEFSSIDVGDPVHVVSESKNIDRILICLSLELDLMNPQNNSYEIGQYIPDDEDNKVKALTDKFSKMKKKKK